MGGLLFASGPDALYTPRMPPAVYYAVRARCHELLRPLFSAVATPVEGPAKADHGDVDLVAAVEEAGELGAETDAETDAEMSATADPADPEALYGPLLRAAAERLGAVRAEYWPQRGRVSVAIPWPEDMAECAPQAGGAPPQAARIQVDLAVCPSRRRLRWLLFRHAHGDLWNILALAVLRPAGLTADERALWLRVPEIEAHNRRRARVFLTDEPAAVLAFLELPAGEDPAADAPDRLGIPWTAPFLSAAALFACVAASRFYTPPPPPARHSAKDRRRARYRTVFRQWVEEVAAAAQTGEDCVDTAAIRDTARAAAFAAFPPARTRYAATRAAWFREQHAAAIHAAAKAAVPAALSGPYRGQVHAAVKRTLFGAAAGTAASSAPTDDDPFAPWTVDSVTAWVTAHWRELGAAAAPELHAQYEAEGS